MTLRILLPLVGFLAAFLLLGCDKKQQPGGHAREQLNSAELEGAWLYENNCAECHETAHPDLHKQPPNLHGLFRRGVLPSGTPATEAQLRQTILEGRGTMPAFDQRLRDEDVENLIRYLRKLN